MADTETMGPLDGAIEEFELAVRVDESRNNGQTKFVDAARARLRALYRPAGETRADDEPHSTDDEAAWRKAFGAPAALPPVPASEDVPKVSGNESFVAGFREGWHAARRGTE